MIEQVKQEREIVLPLLQELGLQQKNQEELSALMQLTGFEDDVVFAKSLFIDRIVQIYKQNKGEYQKFIATDQIAGASQSNRQFLFALFRMYHERKLKNKQINTTQGNYKKQDLSQLQLPDSKDIEEVIKFQKKMYSIFKNLMPQVSTLNQNIYYQQPDMSKYSPFPIYPERSYRHFDSEYFPSIPQSPYLPNFPAKSFTNSFYEDSRRASSIPYNKSDSFCERQSIFSKGQFNQAGQFQKSMKTNKNYFVNSNPVKNQLNTSKGFQKLTEEFQFQQPSKKQKLDQSMNQISTHQNIKKEQQTFKRKKNILEYPSFQRSQSLQSKGINKTFYNQFDLMKKGASQVLDDQFNKKNRNNQDPKQ